MNSARGNKKSNLKASTQRKSVSLNETESKNLGETGESARRFHKVRAREGVDDRP